MQTEMAAAAPPAVEEQFLRAYPEFASTRLLDELRVTEYGRLDRAGHVYLDYTGGGLYAQSQLQAHMDLLRDNVFGNPHSSNPTSLSMTRLVERTRSRILQFFHASADEYEVIFTANASGALKLVGESYPFEPGSNFLLLFDDHNSVNGIRVYAHAHGARVIYSPVLPPDMRVDADRLALNLEQAEPGKPNLFAYPAQSNFSGVQHGLEWIERAHERGWDVLLDAAAFVPTNVLDLSRWHPEFVPVSFYKIFGYPTGVGCLIARREALARLRRPWFAGGTITYASVQGERYVLLDGPEAFEDGTLNYLLLPAVEIGLDYIDRIGMDKIETRVCALTGWLLEKLSSLHHSNGAPVARIYGPVTPQDRGSTVTFNLYTANGHFIDHRHVEERANAVNISLRTGCFCNPGGGELALGLSAEELTSCFVRAHERLTLDEFRRCIDDKSTGAVRVSVGLASTFADVNRFLEFAATFVE
ncbi:MAG: aminotransferase class V-fold PLP-dependent enzyme [Rudaea sp.]